MYNKIRRQVAPVLHCLHPPSAIDIPGNRMAQTRKRHNLFVPLIIDDRAACRNLHGPVRHPHPRVHFFFSRSRCYPTSGPFHTAKRAHVSIGLVTVVDVNARSLVRNGPSGGGFTRDVRQSQALSFAIPRQVVRKEDTICQPQTRSPREEKGKKEGVPRCF